SADSEALDLRAAPRLAAPGRGDVPFCLAFCSVPPDAIDQGREVVDIDAVDDGRFGGLRLVKHDVGLLYFIGRAVPSRSLKRGERRLDALALVFGDQAGKHLPEVRVLGARVDVLPAISLEECRLDRLRLRLADRAAALRREVTRVGFGLGLQNAVHRGD